MVIGVTLRDRYLAVGKAKDDEGDVALVLRDTETDPKGESQARVVMAFDQLVALHAAIGAFIDLTEPVDDADEVIGG